MSDRLCMSCKPCSSQLEMDDDRCSEIYEEYWKGKYPTDPIVVPEICALYYNKSKEDTLNEVLAVLEAVPKECDCEYDLAEKVSKSKVLEAIKKLKENYT